MESLLTYIIQVNLLLALLFLGYQLLLKNLTFYTLNRVYFLTGSVYAFIYPFLNIKDWFAEKIEIPQGLILNYIPFVLEKSEDNFSLNDLLIYILGIGAVLLLVKLIAQLISLVRIHFYSKPSQWREYLFRNVIFPITPFSFFNKIYLHKEQHQELELNDIFKHEHVHVRGHHSIDVLLFEIVLLICWYNPFVWLMRKAVRQNLEFLTDQQVLDKGVDRQTYQYSLLHVTKQGARVGISNQFNFKTLKKRIMMMNKKRSSKLELSKYVFLLPVLIITGITFTVNQAEAKIETVVIKLKDTDLKQQIKEVLIQNKPVDTNKVETVILNTKEYADYVDPEGHNGSAENVMRSITIVKKNGGDSTKNPLIVLDGEEMPKGFDPSNLKPESIADFSVFTGKDAIKYGERGKNGVMVIKTKKNKDGSVYKTPEGLVGELKGVGIKSDKNTSVKFSANTLLNKNGIPLDTEYIINEAKSSRERFNNLDPNQINSIAVIKAANGAKAQIIVVTNDYAQKHDIDNDSESEQSQTIKPARIMLKGEPVKNSSEIENVIITGKGEFSADKVVKDEKKELQEVIVVGKAPTESGSITVRGEPDPTNSEIRRVFISGKKFSADTTVKVSSRELLSSKTLENAFIVIDGKKSSFKDLKKLNPDSIEYLTKLDAGVAKAIYGKKGKDGVIIITTKSNDKK